MLEWARAYERACKRTGWGVLIFLQLFCVLLDAHFDDVFAIRDDFRLNSEALGQHELQWQNPLEAQNFRQENAAIVANTITRDIHERDNQVFEPFILFVENILTGQLDMTEKKN